MGEPRDTEDEVRIAHFTDVHWTAHPSRIQWRDLLSKRILGWINLKLLGRHALFAETGRVLEAFLADLGTVEPDHILCTGDLTGLALPDEFEGAREALKPLLDSPEVTGIPGNHDVYVRSAEKARLYDTAFGQWAHTELEPEDYPAELRTLHPYPLVRFPSEHVALIALRDVRPNPLHDSSGRVGELQLRALEHALRDPRLNRPVKILATHCGFLRAGGSQDPAADPRLRRDHRLHRLRDFSRLLDIATQAGVSLMVHGHTHHRFLCQAGDITPIPVANPGSLTSVCHELSYSVYTCRKQSIGVEARRFDRDTGTFVSWPDAPGVGTVKVSPP